MRTSWLSFVSEWDIPPRVTGALVIAIVVYVRGWLALKRSRTKTISAWRLLSFLAGNLAIFVAVSSPLDTYSATLLFMHMAQRFVLVSVAPPLIVLGCPLVPVLRGLPRSIVRRIGSPLLRSSAAHRIRNIFSRLPVAWLAMNLTYVGRHIPRAYEFALASDLVNTGLSAFMCFSGGLLYPSDEFVGRPFRIDALNDQIAAGVFMWVFGSIVFLIPAIYLTAGLLANGRLMDEKTGLERVRALAQ